MKKTLSYHYLWLLIAFAGISGCNFNQQRKLNRRVTLWRKDKIPYGTYYAYEHLEDIFPSADITINKASPSSYAQFDPGLYSNNTAEKNKKAYIIISPQVVPDDQEVNAMMNFVGQGNYIFISSFRIGDSLMNNLNLKARFARTIFEPRDSLKLSLRDPLDYTAQLAYEYPGDAYSSFITSLDSTYASVLGTDDFGHANFVRINYKGGGAMFIHLAPMAFTNFFLLHKNNKTYYDNAFSYIPQSVKEVKWDDYFRNPHYSNFSSLQFLLGNESLKWALWLLLLLFLLVYLFESKRKQRMIPAITSLRNSSLDFVKTVGRLYYQRRDNLNLANKIIAHFLGHVRTKYNLLTTSLDKDFIDKLSHKSGYDHDLVKDIVDNINALQQQQPLSDEGLLLLNKKIEEFHKHT